VPGLGLLDVDTVMTPEKRPRRRHRREPAPTACRSPATRCISARPRAPTRPGPLLRLADGRRDGAVSADGRVAGTYVHGLFADDAQRAAWLARLGTLSEGAGYEAGVEAALDGLARHIAAHVDCDRPPGACPVAGA
jgi:adenosylcobyric acid synthase